MSLLPTQKTTPNTDLRAYPFLVYGYPKVGKTTWASEIEDALFISTEPGQEALSVYATKVTTWPEFLSVGKALATEEHNFKTAIVDTTGPLFEMCKHHVRANHGFMHESDLDWGKGWSLVKEEFARAMVKLSMLDMGLVLICHADEKEIKTAKGATTKVVPDLPKAARDVLLPLVSFILYFEVLHTDEGDKHVIRTRATDRLIGGMRTPKGAMLPDPLPMNYRAFEAAFIQAFDEEE